MQLFELCRFSGARSSLSDSDAEESDGVELEKSNVLLMGPTGSGLFLGPTFACRIHSRALFNCSPIGAFYFKCCSRTGVLILDTWMLCLTALTRVSGKTLLAKTLARFVNVPFVIADATTLTQVIFTGRSIIYFCYRAP